MVVRYQGGNNAGHTVIVDDTTYKLNLIPSGIIRGKVCYLGQGVVLDPKHFYNEYDQIFKKIESPKVFLSSNISLILEYHKQLDKINELILKNEKKILSGCGRRVGEGGPGGGARLLEVVVVVF